MIDSKDRDTVELLRRVAAEGPDPRRLTRAALAGASNRVTVAPRRRIPLPVTLPAAAALALLAAWAVLYFAPITESAAVAGDPNSIQAQWLDRLGLSPTDLTVSGVTITSSGVSVRVDGVYADAVRTVAVMHSSGGLLDPASVTLSDQFGHQYTVTDAVSNSQTGLQTMTFAALQSPANSLGARLHFAATRTAGDQPVAGNWTLDAVVVPRPGHSLSALGGAAGSWTVSFPSITRSGSSVSVRLRLDGPPVEPTTPAPGPGKPTSDLQLGLTGGGGTLPPAEFEVVGSAGHTDVTALWVGVPDGTYTIDLAVSGATLATTLQVSG